jgi:hypothetical protein
MDFIKYLETKMIQRLEIRWDQGPYILLSSGDKVVGPSVFIRYLYEYQVRW